mmetsp:Transcript_29769/g.43878  ORF Transcript_29769/g.43878 Transcript_29769/m.43878 type:complete len:82 (+) Transcript_29769:261-506(+)
MKFMECEISGWELLHAALVDRMAPLAASPMNIQFESVRIVQSVIQPKLDKLLRPSTTTRQHDDDDDDEGSNKKARICTQEE